MLFNSKSESNKVMNAWAFYDWANSVYPLVISTAVFPIYYGTLFIDSDYVEVFVLHQNGAAVNFSSSSSIGSYFYGYRIGT